MKEIEIDVKSEYRLKKTCIRGSLEEIIKDNLG